MTTRVPLLEIEQTNVVAQAARDYLNAGWQPIPVPSRSKGPDDRKGWQHERWTVADVPSAFSGRVKYWATARHEWQWLG